MATKQLRSASALVSVDSCRWVVRKRVSVASHEKRSVRGWKVARAALIAVMLGGCLASESASAGEHGGEGVGFGKVVGVLEAV